MCHTVLATYLAWHIPTTTIRYDRHSEVPPQKPPDAVNGSVAALTASKGSQNEKGS
jgi:hypothetical protein